MLIVRSAKQYSRIVVAFVHNLLTDVLLYSLIITVLPCYRNPVVFSPDHLSDVDITVNEKCSEHVVK